MTGDDTARGAGAKIRKTTDPVLRQRARPVPRVGPRIQDLMAEMVETMLGAEGIGLAAPQIGVSKRVIVVSTGDELIRLANPEVVESEGSCAQWEGCLSVPGYLGLVERPERVVVSGLNHRGRKVWVEGEGLTARALLHEIDHLDGVLFPDVAREVVKLPPAAALRLVFMGSPDFACIHLDHLLRSGLKVVGVVTGPERRRGRGHRLSPTPVGELCHRREMDVLAPVRVRDAGEKLIEWRPDVIVTCAYGQILPASILEIPALGCVNVHASLLPRYRGAAPIQRAIMDGETVTGVSIMMMDEGMDTGPVLDVREVSIGPDEDAGSLHHRLATAGSRLLLDVLNRMALSEIEPVPQVGEPSWAPALGPEDLIIDWSGPAERIHNQVRALAPLPGARTVLGTEQVKIYRTAVHDEGGDDETPGTALGVSGDSLVVAAGPGGRQRLSVLEVGPAGRPRMTGRDFENGYRARGRVLGRTERS